MSFGRWGRLVGQATYLDARDRSNNTASNGKQMPFHARYRGYLRPELVRVPLPAGLELGAYADAELRMGAYADPANLKDMRTRLLLGCGVTCRLAAGAAAGDGQRGQPHGHAHGRRQPTGRCPGGRCSSRSPTRRSAATTARLGSLQPPLRSVNLGRNKERITDATSFSVCRWPGDPGGGAPSSLVVATVQGSNNRGAAGTGGRGRQQRRAAAAPAGGAGGGVAGDGRRTGGGGSGRRRGRRRRERDRWNGRRGRRDGRRRRGAGGGGGATGTVGGAAPAAPVRGGGGTGGSAGARAGRRVGRAARRAAAGTTGTAGGGGDLAPPAILGGGRHQQRLRVDQPVAAQHAGRPGARRLRALDDDRHRVEDDLRRRRVAVAAAARRPGRADRSRQHRAHVRQPGDLRRRSAVPSRAGFNLANPHDVVIVSDSKAYVDPLRQERARPRTRRRPATTC